MNEDATNAIRLNTRRFDCHNCNYLSLRTLAAKIFDVRTSFPFDRSWYVSSDVFPTMVDCSGDFLVRELSAITRFSLLACLVLRWESGSCWWMGLREHDARKRRAATTAVDSRLTRLHVETVENQTDKHRLQFLSSRSFLILVCLDSWPELARSSKTDSISAQC
jgi:hypothetical protein